MVFNFGSVEADALAVSTTIGLIVALIAASAGVVYAVNSPEEIQALGNSFQTYMYQWGTSAEKLEEVEEFVADLVIYDYQDEDGDGNNDNPHQHQVTLARGILAGIAVWVASLALDGTVEVEGEVAPDGYAYYNGVLLPVPVGHTHWYTVIYRSGDTYKAAYINYGDGSFVAETVGSSWFVKSKKSYNVMIYTDGAWGNTESKTVLNSVCKLDAVLWSNYDITYADGTVAFEGTAPSSVKTEKIYPVYVSDDVPHIQDGTLDPIEILPETITYGNILTSDQSSTDAILGVLQQLASESLSYDDFLSLIQPIPEPEPDPGTEPVEGSDTLADMKQDTFWEKLAEVIRAPIEWLANALLEGIKAIFVPTEDFLTAKVEALRANFAFADSIIETFEMFDGAFLAFDTSPPVIYVDLSATRGSYNLGSKVAFVDLRWYSEYKPTVDVLLSAFMWLVFIWRVGIHLPNIIRGAAGDVPGSIVPSSQEKGLVVQRWHHDY